MNSSNTDNFESTKRRRLVPFDTEYLILAGLLCILIYFVARPIGLRVYAVLQQVNGAFEHKNSN